MAGMTGATVTVLLRVGEGKPAEVGTFELPLRFNAVSPADNYGHLSIEPDLVLLHEGLRRGLLEAADSIPRPPSPSLPATGGEA
ncbi:hypothetical protein A9Z40_03065 [Microbacterium arborescens]|uniref:DUF302 domain-containing protein n=1 Tax=Microbacterium arborescens TaxID=33883 RepID=A0ABX2WI88_9MICO|nr:hypothetical protein [Microbacterium arborescens]OAZ40936.1 hypothetical protein A9Z40_03065 [Microbacterium arborescens]